MRDQHPRLLNNSNLSADAKEAQRKIRADKRKAKRPGKAWKQKKDA